MKLNKIKSKPEQNMLFIETTDDYYVQRKNSNENYVGRIEKRIGASFESKLSRIIVGTQTFFLFLKINSINFVGLEKSCTRRRGK